MVIDGKITDQVKWVILKSDGTTGQMMGQFMSVNRPFTCPVVMFTTGQTWNEKVNK